MFFVTWSTAHLQHVVWRKWNPMYELDALLAACYQEDEMFYFGELCDAVNKAQEQVLTAGHAM